MKIEIEFSEVENLRLRLEQITREKEELQIKLKELSESKLKEDAINLSWTLFDNYLAAVFQHLGFDQSKIKTVRSHSDLEHWLGKYWWNSERVKFELGAEITTEFRQAFLSIGIISKEGNE